MELISKLELARRANRSSQFIDKQQKKVPPVIDFVIKGKTASGKPKVKVNAGGKLTRKFLINCLERGESGQKAQKKKPVPKKKPIKKTGPIIEHAAPEETETYKTPGTESALEKHELEKNKLVLGNEKIKIDNDKKRGRLIPKVLVKRIFGRLYSIDENQLKSIGLTVAPKISAAYAKANRKKTSEILKLIEKSDDPELKKEINKILNTGEPDRILEIRKILEDAIGIILKSIQREIDKFLKNIKELGK